MSVEWRLDLTHFTEYTMDSFRSATIYGMVSSSVFQKEYYKDGNSGVIDRYNELHQN
mgnify:FL=1